MDDSKSCILCEGKLVRGPKDDPAHNFNIMQQKCENCGSYEYFKDQKQRIKDLINSDVNNKNFLLSMAKEKAKGTNKTPRIELD